jgi:hypothetical protein
MAVYSLDTGAMVKRYAAEAGTVWLRSLTDPPAGHDLYAVRMTGPEVIAALARKVRTGQLAAADALRVTTNFGRLRQRAYRSTTRTAIAERRFCRRSGWPQLIDEVEVVGMAPEEECDHEMLVLTRWGWGANPAHR